MIRHMKKQMFDWLHDLLFGKLPPIEIVVKAPELTQRQRDLIEKWCREGNARIVLSSDDGDTRSRSSRSSSRSSSCTGIDD